MGQRPGEIDQRPAEIEAEIEQTRAEMRKTRDDIQDKLSTTTVKAQDKEQSRESLH